MKRLCAIWMLVLLSSCSSQEPVTHQNQKEAAPESPQKDSHQQESETLDTKSDDGTGGGGCCTASFSKLGFQANVQGLDRTFSPNQIDHATLTLGLDALDVIEGLELVVFASMPNDDHGRIIFGVEFQNEQTILIQDISFMMEGNWNINLSFYDGDQVIDQAIVPVKVQEQTRG